MSVLSAGIGEARVTGVICLDPWLTPLSKEIKTGKLTLRGAKQQVFALSTEGYLSQIDTEMESLNC